MTLVDGIRGEQLICVSRKIFFLQNIEDRKVYVAKSPDNARCFVDIVGRWK